MKIYTNVNVIDKNFADLISVDLIIPNIMQFLKDL